MLLYSKFSIYIKIKIEIMVIILNRLVYPEPLNKQDTDLLSLSLFGVFLISVLTATIAFDSEVQLLLYLGVFLIYTVVVLLESFMVSRREYSLYLAIPVFISATQNLYLGIVAPYSTDLQIQMMVITNFLFSMAILLILLVRTPFRLNQSLYKWNVVILTVLVLYSLGTMVLFHANVTSGIASLRNIITPPLFLIIGLMASSNLYLKRFLKYISYIALFVVLFGIVERYLLRDIWVYFNLADLWSKKGIPINPVTNLPANFYSSEMVNGQQLRRMVSSFADPVNLGTFLFFGFIAAWFLKKRILSVLLLASIFMAVSKGAMLGLLVFAVIWSYYKLSKTAFTAVLTGSGLVGVAFIVYSLTNSTMSMLAHVNGFTASLKEMVIHPLGRGLGNIGVLAGLYGTNAESDITETGLGMVIGQLGVIGFVLYIAFFIYAFKQCNRIQEKHEIILAKSLLLSIILNITFNEVALSPNSSAVYFMAIGVLLGRWYSKTKDIPVVKKKRKRIVW